jgi:hypothetical protein
VLHVVCVEEQLRLAMLRLLCAWLYGPARKRLADHIDEEVTGWKPIKPAHILMVR